MQRVFTGLGKPLRVDAEKVDAENWRARRGTAVAMLQILSHCRTPENFIILSGNLRHSCVYDVRWRHAGTHQRSWQVVSSGMKSEFSGRLLRWLDRRNRRLYLP